MTANVGVNKYLYYK